jgi:hypothetical protein
MTSETVRSVTLKGCLRKTRDEWVPLRDSGVLFGVHFSDASNLLEDKKYYPTTVRIGKRGPWTTEIGVDPGYKDISFADQTKVLLILPHDVASCLNDEEDVELTIWGEGTTYSRVFELFREEMKLPNHILP